MKMYTKLNLNILVMKTYSLHKRIIWCTFLLSEESGDNFQQLQQFIKIVFGN